MTRIDRPAAAASALAEQLDAYLGGDHTAWRAGQIEGALADAEDLASELTWYDDLEFGAAMYAPAEGAPYLSADQFGRVVERARDELRRRFGA